MDGDGGGGGVLRWSAFTSNAQSVIWSAFDVGPVTLLLQAWAIIQDSYRLLGSLELL